MNFDELFDKGKKRAALDSIIEGPAKKQNYSGAPVTKTTELEALDDNEPVSHQEILEFVENMDNSTFVESVDDEKTVKKMILSFEKAISKNQEMRLKFPDNPEKFEESEADLAIELKRLLVLAANAKWLPLLAELDVTATLVGLIPHENSDISISTLVLLNELMDEDNFEDEEEEASSSKAIIMTAEQTESNLKLFNRNLLDLGFATVLVENLSRFNEFDRPDDKQGIFMTLNIVENVISIDSGTVQKLALETNLLNWLVNRLKEKANDTNKLYAMELLSIFLQSSDDGGESCAQEALKFGFMPIVLKLLSQFRKKDPVDVEEIELFENAFVALCSVLSSEAGKSAFREEEGFELMAIMIKQKQMGRIRAIKVIDHAISNEYGAKNVRYLLEKVGLGPLFSCYSGKDSKKLKKYKNFEEDEDREHIFSIIVSLFRHLEPGKDRDRIYAKFTENDGEKTSLFCTFYRQALDKMMKNEIQIEKEKMEWIQEVEEDPDLSEEQKEADLQEILEEFYLKKLSKGLFTLQLMALLMGYLLCSQNEGLLEIIESSFSSHKISLDSIKGVLTEYFDHAGDGAMVRKEINELEPCLR